jgi:hypothetical protein
MVVEVFSTGKLGLGLIIIPLEMRYMGLFIGT